MSERRSAIDTAACVSLRRQCELLGISRSGLYYQPALDTVQDLEARHMIDTIYTECPFYGSRRMAVVMSERLGYQVNRKRAGRLMNEMGIAAIGPKIDTSKRNPTHAIYPYLLRGCRPSRPNEVWSTDITYVRLQHGFAYLVAVIDWFSRYVLSWFLSNTMETDFCVRALKAALSKGTPEIFNTDQGSQFTSLEFISVLQLHEIKVSMDGRGRALDNVFVERLWRSVKYEDIYPRGYETMDSATDGLGRYFDFYNCRRPHQSLQYRRPIEIHYGHGTH
jgi:putative transposase